MSHIFVSYSRKDIRKVEKFVENLRRQDFVLWQDVNNIRAGSTWKQAIFDAIQNAEVVLVFWSFTAKESKNVREEIEHAQKYDKKIIPIWLDKDAALSYGLDKVQSVVAPSFTPTKLKELIKALESVDARIQRKLTSFKVNIPMNEQTVEGTKRQTIGSEEYVVVPLINSVYSSAEVIAKPNTIVRKATRIQLIVQNTGIVNYGVVAGAFEAVQVEDKLYPEDGEALVGIYIQGPKNTLEPEKFRVDSDNVSHYTDTVDTLEPV